MHRLTTSTKGKEKRLLAGKTIATGRGTEKQETRSKKSRGDFHGLILAVTA
jgi:hypothetical protein